jgi:hypothetical protein
MLNVRQRTDFRLTDELVLWRASFGESAIGGRVCKTNLGSYRSDDSEGLQNPDPEHLGGDGARSDSFGGFDTSGNIALVYFHKLKLDSGIKLMLQAYFKYYGYKKKV